MEIKNCNSFHDMCEVIKESNEEQIYNLWKSGELKKKAVELNLSITQDKIDNININKPKSAITAQIKEIFTESGCMVLLLILSIPLSFAMGYCISTIIA